MGRSFHAISGAPAPPAGEQQHNPFKALDSQFRVEQEGGRARHLRTRLDPGGAGTRKGDPPARITQTWEVHYVIGSGSRGYSYLTDAAGYLFQTPVSWYAQKRAWDLSPGFASGQLIGRAVAPECLFCHVNRAYPVEGTVNHYNEPVVDGHAIGCQRCHGPGELHLTGAGKGPEGIDPTIVNPKHLAPALRDAVCEQCHLQGAARALRRDRSLFDFRPGLPAELFWSVFLRAPESGGDQKAVGHVEQMHQSRCFQRPVGTLQMGCTTCHDPHVHIGPDRRDEHYRAMCLKCHDVAARQSGCSLPLQQRKQTSPRDSCIVCHMPRYGASDIPHTAATDHRILRVGKPTGRHESASRPGGTPLVSFYRGREGVDDDEDDRGRALALMKLALLGAPGSARSLGSVVGILDGALRRDPDDLPAGEARAYALALQERAIEALAAFDAVLERAPERELALVGAALTATPLQLTDTELGFWRRAVAVNPSAAGYRESLVRLLVKKEAWEEALAESQAWIRLDPLSAEARAARVACLLAAGNKAEARAELARIEALAPSNLRELRIRFEKRLR
jgi:predicted CXXCH cytochrome family protein